MQMSQNTKLLDFVLRGRKDFFHSASAYSPLSGAAFQDNLHIMVYCSGVDYAPCNGILNKNEGYVPNEGEIQDTVAFFKKRAVPFIWWSSAKVLEKYNFQYGGVLTGIALDISEDYVKTPLSSSKVTVKRVQTQDELQAFSGLFSTAFGVTETASTQLHTVSEAAMQQGEQVHFLAYLDCLPVGTATLSITSSSAGIWNLGTLPEYRKMGVGHTLVEAALAEARKRHYGQVMAILMPKGMAWGIFKKLGFHEVCQFPFYVYGVSSDSLE